MNLIDIRSEKHQKLNGGVYPLTTNPSNSIESVLSDSEWICSISPEELNYNVLIHGRISNIRKSGGITFAVITDSTASIQLIFSKKNLDNYSNITLLDLGDIVEITGKTCLSKTEEKSILVIGWTLLTKAIRQPPEKWEGITDKEIKYRQRYLDLISNEESRRRFKTRSNVISLLRDYLNRRDFMEVETPVLSSVASGANAKPFVTHHNALNVDMRLRIAPELNLKRLLVGGFEKVFEIGKNFRNEGIDSRHNPEFTMLEYYEAYTAFDDLIEDTKDLLKYIDRMVYSNSCSFYNGNERPFTFDKFAIVSMREAVLTGLEKAGIVVSENGFRATDYSNLNSRAEKINVAELHHHYSRATSAGEGIAILFEYVAEPFLTEDYRSVDGKYSLPVFITEYPKEISPLARESDKNPGFCDRFELFLEGREIANAFQELNNPKIQAERFKVQLESNNKDPMEYDSDYVEALEYGMPPAVGFGLGIDRLVMSLTNAQNIKDVILFPTLKPLL